jgi:hypothetical protein
MSISKEAKSAVKARPGTKAGQSNEFTLICAMKPGGAERMRKLLADGFTGERQKNTDRIATVHDLRFVIFDNDTHVIFASTFDGDWESYINDFATILPDEIDLLFHECAGYPGNTVLRLRTGSSNSRSARWPFTARIPKRPSVRYGRR